MKRIKMQRFINMGSIEQFRTVVKNVQFSSQYKGQDEDNKPIYDKTAKAPTLLVKYSEKTHGTNMGVSYNNKAGFWVQSRNNMITPEEDNAGCAFAAHTNKDAWIKIIYDLSKEYSIDLDKEIITIYAEWAGGNIQKSANVSGIDKLAIIFDYFKVSPLEYNEDDKSEWFETCVVESISNKTTCVWVDNSEYRIFNVNNIPMATGFININFERPDLANNELIEIMERFEKNSPIAKFFGVPDNIGEGIVCSFFDNKGTKQNFKVKGEAHSNSKIKTLKAVDSEKEQNKIDFVNNHAIKGFRLEQAWQHCFGIENEKTEPSMTAMGDFIRFIVNDTIKEESDLMIKAGLEPKEINSLISKVSRSWFIEKLNSEIKL